MDIYLKILLHRQYILQPTLFILSSVEKRPKVVSTIAINVSDSIFQELENFINLNEKPISV